MTEKQTELLPCPFCGSTNVDPHGWMNNAGVQGPACDDCGASAGSVQGSTAENIAAWNNRTPLIAQAPAMLRELERVRAIISEAALVGFQPLEGDWAERLFKNQSDTVRVVEAAGGNAHFRHAATGEAS